MLGTLVALYELILNALPILLSQPQSKASTHTHERSLFRQSVKRNAGLLSADSPLDEDASSFDEEHELAMPDRSCSSWRTRLSASAQAHADAVVVLGVRGLCGGRGGDLVSEAE